MRKKILSLALALALCLGLTIPALAAETLMETINGITITANPNGTLSYTGAGTITGDHIGYGAEMLLIAMDGDLNGASISINVERGISVNELFLKDLEGVFYENGAGAVTINTSTAVSQTVGGFTDVKPGDYFADPVVWAVDRNITAGTSKTTFSPNENCTVAQILSFLWRANGSPKVRISNPFSDVKSSDYYYDAALWAYGKGMVTGSTFGGNSPCTRSMAVTYIWQAAGISATAPADFDITDKGLLAKYSGSSGDVVIPSNVTAISMYWYKQDSDKLTSVTIPSSVTLIERSAFAFCRNLTDVYYEGSEAQWKAINAERPDEELLKATIHYNSKMPGVDTGFTDVPATVDYAPAVAWAVENGVTAGTSATTFSPDSVCTRAQIVSFLYRALPK